MRRKTPSKVIFRPLLRHSVAALSRNGGTRYFPHRHTTCSDASRWRVPKRGGTLIERQQQSRITASKLCGATGQVRESDRKLRASMQIACGKSCCFGMPMRSPIIMLKQGSMWLSCSYGCRGQLLSAGSEVHMKQAWDKLRVGSGGADIIQHAGKG